MKEHLVEHQYLQVDVSPVLPERAPRSPRSPRRATSQAGPPKASAIAVTVNLITAALGCGILSLPWATAGSSILPGAFLTLFVLVLNGCTIMILVIAAEREQIFDLGGLFKKMPRRWGGPARVFCDLTIWFSCFLCLVGNLIVAADSMSPMLKYIPFLAQNDNASVPIVFLAVLPLCALDQRHLAFSSGAAVLANIYALGLILTLFYGENHGVIAEHCCLLNWGPGVVSMLSVLMQAVVMQMCVLPMYEVLERRSPKRFLGCLVVGFSFVFLLFVIFSASAYLMYGPDISSNVLNNLPNSLAGDVARIGMGITALAVYPIMLLSMIVPIQHSELRAMRRKKDFFFPSPRWEQSPMVTSTLTSPASPQIYDSDLSPLIPTQQDPFGGLAIPPAGQKSFWTFVAKLPAKPSSIVSVIVVCFSALGAVWCPDLGTVNIYSGGMSVAGLVALAPGLMGIYFMGRQSVVWFLSMIALLLFGFMATFLELRFTEREIDQVQRDCIWRL